MQTEKISELLDSDIGKMIPERSIKKTFVQSSINKEKQEQVPFQLGASVKKI